LLGWVKILPPPLVQKCDDTTVLPGWVIWKQLGSVLWIRIGFMRIRIQLFFISMRIRIRIRFQEAKPMRIQADPDPDPDPDPGQTFKSQQVEFLHENILKEGNYL
jgi:hypothetical protein